MTIPAQLQRRRIEQGKSLQSLADLTATSTTQVDNALSGEVDLPLSIYQALADVMDAKLVLIPKDLIAEVFSVLSGKYLDPDDVPSTLDQLFGKITN